MNQIKKEFDVVALGELLIDFTQNGFSRHGNPMFEANPGGAPCNVLSMLQNLGRKTAFIGKVGRDSFGSYLKTILEELGIDNSNLVFDNHIPTTLAFVHTLADGDREFSFYRSLGADMMLSARDVNTELFRNAKIFHFGSLSLTDRIVREATKLAVTTAKKENLLISFDPNLRPPLWNTLSEAKEQITYGLSQCDVLKISDNELEFVTGIKNIQDGVHALVEKYPIKLITVTMGKNGSYAFYKDIEIYMKAFSRQKVIDTTGAGDTFCACILNDIIEYGLNNLTEERLKMMLRFSNAAASLITAKKGALRVMPKANEILDLLY